MEGNKNAQHWDGRTVDNDPKERLPYRPTAVVPITFYDHGSSFLPGPSKKQTTGTVTKERSHTSSQSAPKSSAPPLKRTSSKISTRKSIIQDSDEDDQLDCLSSQPEDDPSSRLSPVRRKTGKAPVASSDSDDVVEVSNLVSRANSTSDAIKKIKFRKNKDATATVPVHEVEDDSFNLSTPKPRVFGSITGGYRHPEERRPLPRQNSRGFHDSSIRPGEGSYERVDSRPLTDRNVKSNRAASPPRRRNDNPNVLRRKARPRDSHTEEIKSSQPKVIPNSYRNSEVRSSKSILGVVDRKFPKASGSQTATSSLPTRTRSRSKSVTRYSSDELPERPTHKKRKTPDPFPEQSPTSSPVPVKRATGPFPHLSPLAGSKASPPARSAVNSKKALPARAPAAFPILSPTKYDVSDDPPKSRDKGKGKAPNKENDEDKNAYDWVRKKKVKAIAKQKKPEAFPMNSQMLESLDSTSPLRPKKRLSEDGSGDEHTPKKSRKNHEP